MLRVIECITVQHDIRLVVLAGVLCFLASLTSLSMVDRAAVATSTMRGWWIGSAGFVAGSGIWATHFIAILAFRPGMPIAFDSVFTALSAIIAIVLSASGFYLALSRAGPVVGGAVIGVAVSAMHYAGMNSLQIPADALWDYGYVAASIAIGVIGMIAAATVAIRTPSLIKLGIGSLLFAAAICGMHFTGMTAVVYQFNPLIVVPNELLAPEILAIAVAASVILIIAVGAIGASLDHHLMLRATAEGHRLQDHSYRLKQKVEELEVVKRELVAAKEMAESANRAKSEFLANMSHELRTPLNAIIGFSEIMKTAQLGPISDRYSEYSKDIFDSGRHLLSIISDILDLSKLDSGNLSLNEEGVDLQEIVHGARLLVSGTAEGKNVRIVNEQDTGCVEIRGDPLRLKQILINLLSNAVKFTPSGGEVSISTSLREDGGVRIAVRDTGIGMDAAGIKVALKPFGQVKNKMTRVGEGTGLGLPLAKRLAEAHGGSMRIKSKPGIGTTVAIDLPASRVVTPNKRLVA